MRGATFDMFAVVDGFVPKILVVEPISVCSRPETVSTITVKRVAAPVLDLFVAEDDAFDVIVTGLFAASIPILITFCGRRNEVDLFVTQNHTV